MWLPTGDGTVYLQRQGLSEYHLLAQTYAELETLREQAGIRAAVVEAEDAGFSYRVSAGPTEVLTVLAYLDGSVEVEDFRALLLQANGAQERERIARLTWSMMQRLLLPTCSPGGMSLLATDIDCLDEAWREIWREEV